MNEKHSETEQTGNMINFFIHACNMQTKISTTPAKNLSDYL